MTLQARLLLILLSLFMVACFDWSNTNTTQTGPTTVGVPGGQASPSPGASPTPSACPTVARVVIQAPNTLAVGASAQIDATPKDASGLKRPPECDQADGILWIQSGPCSLSNQLIFNPTLTGGPLPAGTSSGTCGLQARVAGVASDPFAVQIR